VIENLPRTVAEQGGAACDALLRELARQLADEPRPLDQTCEEAAACSLGELGPLLEPAQLERAALAPILAALQQPEPAEGAELLCAWLQALLVLLEGRRLPEAAVARSVLPFATAHGDAGCPVTSRMVCCHVLGAATRGYGAAALAEPRTLAHALALCQDTDTRVRQCMCAQLVPLSLALGPARAAEAPLHELLELIRDEQPEVRAAAYAAAVALLPTSDGAKRRALLEPAVAHELSSVLQALEQSDGAAAGGMMMMGGGGGGGGGTCGVRDLSPIRGTAGVATSPELLASVAEHAALYLAALREVGSLPPPPVATPHAVAAAVAAANAGDGGGAGGGGAPFARNGGGGDEGGGALVERLLGCLARCANSELRCVAATALPQLAVSCGAEATARLHRAVLALVGDADPSVRAAAAATLLPLCRALPMGGEAEAAVRQQLMMPPLLRLLDWKVPTGAQRGAHAAASLLPGLDRLAETVEVLVVGVAPAAAAAAASGASTPPGSSVRPGGCVGPPRRPSPPPGGAAAPDAAAVDLTVTVGGVCARLLPALTALDATLAATHSWRGRHSLLSQLPLFVASLEPGALSSQLLPLLFRHISVASAEPTRRVAVGLICQLMRRLRTTAQRADVCARLVRELGFASQYSLRLLFLDTCATLLGDDGARGCSRAYFKQHGFLARSLELAADGVPSVRRRLCELQPQIKRTLRLPADAQSLETLHLGAAAMLADPSPDVREAAAAALPELSAVEITMEGIMEGLARGGGGGPRTDALDAMLQAEEDAMRCAEQEALDKQPQRPRRASRDLQALPPRDGAHGAHGAHGRPAASSHHAGDGSGGATPPHRQRAGSTAAAAPGAAKPAGGGPGDAAARKPRPSKEHHGVTCTPPTPPNERRRRVTRERDG